MTKFKDLFEDEGSKTPIKLLPALVSKHMGEHGLAHESSSTKDGYARHVFSGPKMKGPEIDKLGKKLRQHGFYHDKYVTMSRKRYDTFHGPSDAEVNKPSHRVDVTHKDGVTKMTYTVPSEDRLAVSRRSYEHGDASVEGHNEGSIHYRTARGPSRESVEDAFDHYLAAHGTDRETESKKRGGAIMSNSTQEHGAHFSKTWNHFRSDL